MSVTLTDRVRSLAALLREPPALLAVAFNLVPAVCVLLFGWSPAILILLYWAENVALGVFQLLRMNVTTFRDGIGIGLVGLIGSAFFVVHYGLFCLAHGLFALSFLGFERGLPNTDQTIERLVMQAPEILRSEKGFALSLVAIVVLQAVAFVQWIVQGAWKTADDGKLMGEVYGRIVVLHLTLFATAFALDALDSPTAGVFALALFKSVAEGLFAGNKARKARAVA